MSRHDLVWGVIVAVLVFGGYLEWFLERMTSKENTDRDDA